MKKGICHHHQLAALRRVEGQVRGVQKMIENRRYCVDILHALGAATGALRKVERGVLRDHLKACAEAAFTGKSKREKDIKLNEILGLLTQLKS